MKTLLAFLGQFVLFLLFLAVFFSGSFLAIFHLDPFHAQWFVSHPSPTSIRFFVPTGLILMTIFYIVVFAIEAARNRLRSAGPVDDDHVHSGPGSRIRFKVWLCPARPFLARQEAGT